MHTFHSCRTADGVTHSSPPGIRSPYTSSAAQQGCNLRYTHSLALSLSLSLSLTHTNTHTRCSSGTSLAVSLARDIYEVAALEHIRPKKTNHRWGGSQITRRIGYNLKFGMTHYSQSHWITLKSICYDNVHTFLCASYENEVRCPFHSRANIFRRSSHNSHHVQNHDNDSNWLLKSA